MAALLRYRRADRHHTTDPRTTVLEPLESRRGPGRQEARVASEAECRDAVARLAARFAEVDADVRREHAPDRTLACRVPDLDLVYSARLHESELVGIRIAAPTERPDIRVTVHSDDLVALVDGTLPVVEAWAGGRLKIDASLRDLLRLRSLL